MWGGGGGRALLIACPSHTAVAEMCQLLAVDLDAIAVDLGTTLCSLLDSTHESQRQGAVVAFRCLSVKCSSAQAALDLLALLSERIAASRRAGADQRSAFVTGGVFHHTLHFSLCCGEITCASSTACSSWQSVRVQRGVC